MRYTILIATLSSVVASVLTTVVIGGSLFGAGTVSSANAPVEVEGAISPGGLEGILQGDADCDTTVGTRDSQALLRKVLQQPPLSQTQPCPLIGTPVTVDGLFRIWGDWDCDGTVGTRDSQAILRNVLQQPALSQTGDCPGIGDPVQVHVGPGGKGGTLGELVTPRAVVLGGPTETPAGLPPTGGYQASDDEALPWEISLLLLPLALALSVLGFRRARW